MYTLPEGSPRIPGRILAAPSWVFAGTLVENCLFLTTRVDEAGLLFFETKACLAYGAEDVPASLAALPLSYHVHLPTDLPMHQPQEAARLCLSLLHKTGVLRKGGPPLAAVLHPPKHDLTDSGRAARLLEAFTSAFAALGGAPSCLLLENVRGNDLTGLKGVIREFSLGTCIDMGHALAYEQKALLKDTALLERAGMLHLSAPGGLGNSAHLPLTILDPHSSATARALCRAVSASAVVMLELFCWRDIELSLPLARSWLLSSQ